MNTVCRGIRRDARLEAQPDFLGRYKLLALVGDAFFVDARGDDWVSCPRCGLTWSLHNRYPRLVRGR